MWPCLHTPATGKPIIGTARRELPPGGREWGSWTSPARLDRATLLVRSLGFRRHVERNLTPMSEFEAGAASHCQ